MSGNETKTFFERTKDKKSILNVFKESLYTIDSPTISNDKYFTFAWENDSISQGAISCAENILKETNILVIIGYSFPTFNDDIDKRLFKLLKESTNFKKIYFQDPNANKEFLFTRFGIPEEKIKIVEKNMNQFILPIDSHSLSKEEPYFEIY
ncbi:MAG: hypothetical protein H0U95_01045 [Bacteroidetes bacterium]|nr:hypothetical protein [Bacteroidota bacterium]